MLQTFRAALFDLDGVVIDTESQYSQFWGLMGHDYLPEVPDFANLIKGQTLTQIYEGWFSGKEALQAIITKRLNAFEQQMAYPYIPGVTAFLQQLHNAGIRTAIVTSSNVAKMNHVYEQHPEFQGFFDCILTSEDFSASKPDPACYLLAASKFGVKPSECVVFEDSRNGLLAARASGAYVVGLSTTLPLSTITPMADKIIPDFESFMEHGEI